MPNDLVSMAVCKGNISNSVYQVLGRRNNTGNIGTFLARYGIKMSLQFLCYISLISHYKSSALAVLIES